MRQVKDAVTSPNGGEHYSEQEKRLIARLLPTKDAIEDLAKSLGRSTGGISWQLSILNGTAPYKDRDAVTLKVVKDLNLWQYKVPRVSKR